MKNRFEIRGSIAAIFLDSRKFGRQEALIDVSDLPKVNAFPNTWFAHWDPTINDFYCRGKVTSPDGKRRTIYLHRWITNCPKHLQVDHFDNNPLNNCRANLRILSNAQNQQNLRGAQRNSKSGILGVHWLENQRRWAARIEVDGRQLHLGVYREVFEAAEVVRKARAELMPYSKEAAIAIKEKKLKVAALSK